MSGVVATASAERAVYPAMPHYAVLVGGVEHGDDVLRRHVGQDVVNLLKHETAARRENRNLPANVLADFVGRGVRENETGVAAAAPKREPVAEIAFQPGGVHAGARDLHGIRGVEPRFDQVGDQRADPAAAVEHDLDVGQFLRPPPHLGVPRFEELLVHGAGDLRAVLHAQVVAERNDVDVRPDRRQKSLQVRQVDFDQAVEELVRPLRIAGQQHQEVVVAIEELADFQQVAAEEADDGAIGLFAQLAGALGEHALPVGSGHERPRRTRDGAPHVLAQRLRQPVEIVVLDERPVTLLEVDGAVGHPGEHSAAGRTQHPLFLLPLGQGPGRHLAGRAVGQGPIGPVFVFQRKPAPQLDRIDLEPFEHVVVDDGQLLDRVVNADRPWREPQGLAKLGIRHRGDARRPMPAKIDRRLVGLPMIERGQHTFSRCHVCISARRVGEGTVNIAAAVA